MPLAELFDRLLKKRYSAEQINNYIGTYQTVYFGHARDHLVRSNASSGGAVTAILASLLLSGEVDAALVCDLTVQAGRARPVFRLAHTLDELIVAQGSKYITTPFSSEAMALLRAYQGRLAVVCLPCDANLLARVRKNEPELDAKIHCVITLFCGHLSSPALTDLLSDKLRPEAEAELVAFRHRSGHWRGRLTAEYHGGELHSKKFAAFSKYQNLYYFCETKCLHCHDHVGYASDIAVGDIWLQRMKKDPIKHSAILVKTARGAKCLKQALEAGQISLEERPIEDLIDAQSRSFKIHYNVSARAKAGKKLGLKIEDTVHEKVRWHDELTARIILQNYLLTQSAEGRAKVAGMSSKRLTLQLYLLKLLEVL